jgi:hypothetical protein
VPGLILVLREQFVEGHSIGTQRIARWKRRLDRGGLALGGRESIELLVPILPSLGDPLADEGLERGSDGFLGDVLPGELANLFDDCGRGDGRAALGDF